MSFNLTRRMKRGARGKGFRGGMFVRLDGSATKASFDWEATRAKNKAARAARKRNRGRA